MGLWRRDLLGLPTEVIVTVCSVYGGSLKAATMAFSKELMKPKIFCVLSTRIISMRYIDEKQIRAAGVDATFHGRLHDRAFSS